jgi:hypothetical protein
LSFVIPLKLSKRTRGAANSPAITRTTFPFLDFSQGILKGLGLENAHAHLTNVKVNELSFLVRDVTAELPAHKHVPAAKTNKPQMGDNKHCQRSTASACHPQPDLLALVYRFQLRFHCCCNFLKTRGT